MELTMKRAIALVSVIFSLVGIAACAGITNGVRIYPQKVYLFVDKDKGVSKVLTLPDLKNSYQVLPWSFLSKHNFVVKVQEGQVTELSSDQDSSGAIALLQKIVEVGGDLAKAQLAAAAKGVATGTAVADIDFTSSFGLETGIYELGEFGKFVAVSR
jgi:hypothetical protein